MITFIKLYFRSNSHFIVLQANLSTVLIYVDTSFESLIILGLYDRLIRITYIFA